MARCKLLGKGHINSQSSVEKSEQRQRRVDAAELFEFAKVYEKPVEFFDPDG